jgi:hypothetical protein
MKRRRYSQVVEADLTADEVSGSVLEGPLQELRYSKRHLLFGVW